MQLWWRSVALQVWISVKIYLHGVVLQEEEGGSDKLVWNGFGSGSISGSDSGSGSASVAISNRTSVSYVQPILVHTSVSYAHFHRPFPCLFRHWDEELMEATGWSNT